MADENESGKPDGKPGRRFRVTRRVKTEAQIPEAYSEQVMREEATEEADRGTPEMDREVSKGCMGCLRVTLLFFLIMLASIVATWFIRRRGV